MGRRTLACLMSLVMAFVLSGCWSYKGLDQLNIVVGIAVDYDKENKLFLVDYEVADLTGADKQSSIGGRIIRSQGKTLFEAARNAKRKEDDRLYFGSSNVLVISHQIVQEMGIKPIMDWFLRDGECRETINVVLSQEETAAEILETTEENKGVMSASLHDIIREDNKISASSTNMKMFQIFGSLHTKRNSVMLPVLHKTKNVNKEIPELNGIGVLKGDKLIGYLTPDQSKYALFVEDKIVGGLLTLSVTDLETDDITLEIIKNKTKKSVSYQDNKIKVTIKTKTSVAAAENLAGLSMMDQEVIRKLEHAAEEKLETNIRDVVSTLQNEFRTDVFGFGEMIYRKDLKLWQQLEPHWEDIYPTVEVEVSSKVQISNSAFIK